jgi:hypothetical protein
MTSYLSPATIRAAVDRLGVSRGQSILIDYLVFKRALVIDASTGTVVSGTKAGPYNQAIDELSRVADPANSERPYFLPPGARRDSGRGYRTKKYPSNGPSDTASRWQSKNDRPIELVDGTSPKEFRPVARNASELATFFLNAETSAAPDKPRLIDFAIWYHRASDLDSLDVEPDQLVAALVARAQAEIGITDVEVEGLFLHELTFDAGIATEPSVASPSDYLPVPPVQSQKAATPTTAVTNSRIQATAIEEVVSFVAAKGFVFDPWQIAAFVTAVRTKPFVILAGISGTGKTKLPKLVAEATGAQFRRIPVRPDWTDSSELLGYERLGSGSTFVPGHLLRVAKEAQQNPEQQFFALLDEMNVARVEYYLAEVLSHIEEREAQADGTIASDPLVPNASDDEWKSIRLPGNLTIVGSVNMDETTFGFSRKVLDRSFVIEFSTVSLSSVNPVTAVSKADAWSVEDWRQQALSLADHPNHNHEDVGRVITALEAINQALTPLQMQVGYRVRDEIAMFVLSAHDCPDSFVGNDASVINPLDVAIAMKVLPRIQGTGPALRVGLELLVAWADPQDATASTTGIETESFPFCADRLRMMLQRLDETGFTSFWL